MIHWIFLLAGPEVRGKRPGKAHLLLCATGSATAAVSQAPEDCSLCGKEFLSVQRRAPPAVPCQYKQGCLSLVCYTSQPARVPHKWWLGGGLTYSHSALYLTLYLIYIFNDGKFHHLVKLKMTCLCVYDELSNLKCLL